MAATGNESNDLSLSESTDFENYEKTSVSISVLQSSPEPQQLGSPQTDQNLSKDVYRQIKITSTPSRKRGTFRQHRRMIIARKYVCNG